jgi:predicted phosphodiesterase
MTGSSRGRGRGSADLSGHERRAGDRSTGQSEDRPGERADAGETPMLIAILSDIHDNIPKLRAAVDHIQRVDALLCGGDLCSPFIVDELAQFPRQIHVVFGNNDADLFRITQKAAAANQDRSPEDQIRLHGEFFEGELGGKRIALIHFEQIG